MVQKSKIENRKLPIEYSKILADLPSEQIFTEITRWVPLSQYYTAFLQSFYRRSSGRR